MQSIVDDYSICSCNPLCNAVHHLQRYSTAGVYTYDTCIHITIHALASMINNATAVVRVKVHSLSSADAMHATSPSQHPPDHHP
jgi:hypothetical protein